jgi:hypothetical protein
MKVKTKHIGRTATKVERYLGEVTVRYHNTDVVRITECSVILNHGGYITRTTIRRMNEASKEWNLGYSVRVVRGTPVIYWGGVEIDWIDSNRFTIMWDGNPLNNI